MSYIERLGGIAPGPQLLETDDEALKNLAFISSVVRIAQSMGLHQECAYSRLDPLIHEMHRRIRGTLFVSITNTPFIRLANVLQNGGQPMGYAKVSEASDEPLRNDSVYTRAFESCPQLSLVYSG